MMPEAWGAYHVNDRVRQHSSSGGVFSAFAESILEKGGAVFGAVLYKDANGQFGCRHISCESKNDLDKLCGSKYLPSNLKNTFSGIENYLKKGRQVFFCGTPCQVAALRAFLGKSYEALYTVDVICHGIPAPVILRKLVEEKNADTGKTVVDVKFRDKSIGWKNYGFVMQYDDQTTSFEEGTKSDFMKLFLSDLFLRPSCFTCQYKGKNYKSDITIGDFWGVEQYLEVDAEKQKDGISVVVIHTEQGKKLFALAKDKLKTYPTTMDYFDRSNIFYTKSPVKPMGAWLFSHFIVHWPIRKMIHVVRSTERYLKKLGRLKKRYGKSSVKHKERPFQIVEKNECYGCMACHDVCKVHAIEITEDSIGFLYPKVNEEKCINCGKCKKVCPRLRFPSP